MLRTSALRWPDSARRCHASDARKLAPTQPSGRSERHHGGAVANCCHDACAGGQCKRTNIGIALVSDPKVLFMDEPTSGLDSFTANEVCTRLRDC